MPTWKENLIIGLICLVICSIIASAILGSFTFKEQVVMIQAPNGQTITLTAERIQRCNDRYKITLKNGKQIWVSNQDAIIFDPGVFRLDKAEGAVGQLPAGPEQAREGVPPLSE